MKNELTFENSRFAGAFAAVVAVLALTLSIAAFPAPAFAAEDDIASGTWGTCPWSIDANGCLTIGAGTGIRPESGNSWPWGYYGDSVTSVVVSGNAVAPNDSSSLFWNMKGLKSADLRGLDVSGVENMMGLFGGCDALESVQVDGWDTRKVRDMSYMFYSCFNLQKLDLSSFETGSLQTIASMFERCHKLGELRLDKFDVSGITSETADSSFLHTDRLARVKLGPKSCYVATGSDVYANPDISSDMPWRSEGDGERFESWSDLAAHAASAGEAQWYTRLGADIATGENGSCTWSIDEDRTLTIRPTSGNEGELELANITGRRGWWTYCYDIAAVKIKAGVTANSGSLQGMFSNESNLTSVDLSGLDASGATTIDRMFFGCSSLQELDLSTLDTSNATSMFEVFRNCFDLKTIKLGGQFSTAQVQTMEGMFEACWALTNVDMGSQGFDTGNVTTMASMFDGCSSLRSIDVSRWNTSSLTSINAMFIDCPISSLDLSKWDVSHVQRFSSAFQGCGNLTQLNISGWNTPEATNLSSMFQGCSLLKSLDLAGWDTSKTTNMSNMFAGCELLSSVSFGDAFKFSNTEASTALPTPTLTGMWLRATDKQTMTPTELQSASINNPASIAGTWIWLVPGFSFANSAESFGYALSRQRLPLEAYQRVLSPAQAKLAYDAAGWWWSGDWRGSCYGMAAGAAMLETKDYVSVNSFDDTKGKPFDLEVEAGAEKGLSLQQYIESMQASLFDPQVQWALNHTGTSLAKESDEPIEDLISAVREASAQNGFVLVTLWTRAERFKHGHAVLAYAVRDKGTENGRREIDVYDPDDPGTPHMITTHDAKHHMTWSYEVKGTAYSGGYLTSDDTVTGLAYVPYDTLSAPWKANNTPAVPVYSLAVGSDDFSVQAGGRTARVSGGVLQADSATEAYQFRDVYGLDKSPFLAGQADGETGDEAGSGEGVLLYLPTGSTYRVENDDASEPLEAAIAEAERSVSVSAGAGSSASFEVNDEDGVAKAVAAVPDGVAFSVSIEVPVTDAAEGSVKTVVASGVGDGSGILLAETSGEITHDVPAGTTLKDGEAETTVDSDPRAIKGADAPSATQGQKAQAQPAAPAKTKISKLKKAKKVFTATWKRSADASGYQVRYSLKKNMKKAKTKTVAGGGKTKLKVKKLKSKKRYYVQVRSYKEVNGTKYYSAWSAKKSVKVK